MYLVGGKRSGVFFFYFSVFPISQGRNLDRLVFSLSASVAKVSLASMRFSVPMHLLAIEYMSLCFIVPSRA